MTLAGRGQSEDGKRTKVCIQGSMGKGVFQVRAMARRV